MSRVRPEAPGDRAAVRDVLVGAFDSKVEADIVDALRGETGPQISLVAEEAAGIVVGQILFTPVEIRSSSSRSTALGLGPMAVSPPYQRRGVGSALVQARLSACRDAGELVVVVLGHPSYYPRFGFRPAWDFGLYFRTPGPNAAFMVNELDRGALRGRTGEVRYHAAFTETGTEEG